MAEPLLQVRNLQTTFFTQAGPIQAVAGISYEIHRGETVGIVGESGCGKSVTSLSILGLLSQPGRVTGGEVLLDGRSLVDLPEGEMRQIRGNKVAMIFQEPMTALNPVMTVGDQITEQIRAHEPKTSDTQARQRVLELFNLVGIPAPESRVDAYPHQLSGGMRQRAMIAMALSCNPDLLIADEPTTALDVTIQAQILSLLESLQEKLGMAIQFITHDLGVIAEMSDRIVVMYAGKIVEQGKADDVLCAPQHPYTVGLLNSIPRIDQDVSRLNTIEGMVPSLLGIGPGCRFAGRCPRVSERCTTQEPPLIETKPGRFVACFTPHGALA